MADGGLDFLGFDSSGAPLFRPRGYQPPAPQQQYPSPYMPGGQINPMAYQPGGQFYQPPHQYGGGGYGHPAQMWQQMQAMMQQMIQQGMAGGGSCGVNPSPCGQVNGRQSLGFPAQAIGAGLTVDITRNPQRPIQPDRLIVPAAIGANFAVVDIKIGNVSQLNAAGELPALMFSETATYVLEKMDPAYVGNNITLTIRNTDGVAPHTFAAAMIGQACGYVGLPGYSAGVPFLPGGNAGMYLTGR